MMRYATLSGIGRSAKNVMQMATYKKNVSE